MGADAMGVDVTECFFAPRLVVLQNQVSGLKRSGVSFVVPVRWFDGIQTVSVRFSAGVTIFVVPELFVDL